MAANQPQWLTKFKAQLSASPGKAALLGLLGVVLVAVVGVQFARAPGSAQAAAPAAEAPDPPVAAVALAEMSDDEGSTEQPFAPAERLECPKLARQLSRDPFGLQWSDYFPSATGIETEDSEVPSALEPGEELEPEEFVLEATFCSNASGGESTAIINGFKVGVNDRLGRYLVKTIGPRHVVLADQGREIVVRMP